MVYCDWLLDNFQLLVDPGPVGSSHVRGTWVLHGRRPRRVHSGQCRPRSRSYPRRTKTINELFGDFQK